MTVQEEKKILRKFDRLIKCYHKFCEKYGCSSWALQSLIKFLHEKGFETGKHLISNNGNCYLSYREQTFNLESLLEYFRI